MATNDSLFVKSAIWGIAAKLVATLLSFISIPLFTRLLTTEEFGMFAIFTAWAGILAPIIGMGLHLCIGRAKTEFPCRFREFNIDVYIFITISFFTFLFLFLVFPQPFEVLIGLQYNLILLLLFQVIFSLFVIIGIEAIRFENKYKAVAVTLLFQPALSLVLSVFFIQSDYIDSSVVGRIYAVVFVDLIFAFVYLFYFFSKGYPFSTQRFTEATEHIRFGLKFSTPLIFGVMAVMLNNHFDRIFISKYLGAEETGIYSFTYSITMLILILNATVIGAITPWIYERLNRGDKQKVESLNENYIKIFTYIIVIFLLISPEFIKLLAPEPYWEGIVLVPALLLGAYFQVLSQVETTVQMYLKETKINALIIILGAFANVGLNVLTIPLYGVKAAAATTALTFLLMFLCFYLVNRRRLKCGLCDKQIYIKGIAILSLFCLLFIFVDFGIAARWGIAAIIFTFFVKYLYLLNSKYLFMKVLMGK